MGDDSKKFCYKCGKELTGDIQFCPYCGADQAPQSNTIKTESKVINDTSNNQNSNNINTQDVDSKTWVILDVIGWVVFVFSFIPGLDLGFLVSLALGIVIQKKFNHKGAGMGLWIPSAILFGILFMIGFISGFLGAI